MRVFLQYIANLKIRDGPMKRGREADQRYSRLFMGKPVSVVSNDDAKFLKYSAMAAIVDLSEDYAGLGFGFSTDATTEADRISATTPSATSVGTSR